MLPSLRIALTTPESYNTLAAMNTDDKSLASISASLIAERKSLGIIFLTITSIFFLLFEITFILNNALNNLSTFSYVNFSVLIVNSLFSSCLDKSVNDFKSIAINDLNIGAMFLISSVNFNPSNEISKEFSKPLTLVSTSLIIQNPSSLNEHVYVFTSSYSRVAGESSCSTNDLGAK